MPLCLPRAQPTRGVPDALPRRGGGPTYPCLPSKAVPALPALCSPLHCLPVPCPTPGHALPLPLPGEGGRLPACPAPVGLAGAPLALALANKQGVDGGLINR
jgi:hypothetical protein